jgi:hypothetical protein
MSSSINIANDKYNHLNEYAVTKLAEGFCD